MERETRPLYEQIAEIRKNKGISANVLAQTIDVAASTITRYEHGERPLTTDKAAEILDALNVDIKLIDYPLPRPSADRLRTIAKSQIAEDILELQFLALYSRQRTAEGRERLIRKFAAGYYEADSGRPTNKDKGVEERDNMIIEEEEL